MTQQVNTKYTRLLEQRQLSMVYLVQFDGIPTRFTTKAVRNALGAYKPYLSNLQGAGAQITVDEGRASLGQVTFDILDKNQEFTQLAFLYQLANRVVTIYGGFSQLQEDEYVLLFTGRVLDYTLQNNNITWSIQCTDLAKDEQQDLFNAFSKLTAPVLAAAVILPVDNSLDFPNATGGVLYLKVDDEVISYTGRTDTSFTGCTRGDLGTVAADHDQDAQVLNFAFLQGNPLTLALQILTSTGDGTNGDFDVLPACCGLAIPQAFIDLDRFTQQRDTWLSSWQFTFEEFAKVPGKQFLEEQIYTFTNSYPVTNAQGQISLKVYAPPLPNQIARELNDSNTLEPPSFKGNVLANYFWNEFDLSYDWDWLSQTFLSRLLREDSTSQELFGQTKTRTLLSRGIRVGTLPGEMTQSQVDSFGTRFLKRFSIPPPLLGARAFYSQRLLEVGDIVPLTSAFLPNLATGKLGVDHLLMEVIQIDPDYLGANQSYLLLNTGYSYGKKYAAISPPTNAPINFPVFSAATPAQKNYAFISREIGPTEGVMGDGSPGYVICP